MKHVLKNWAIALLLLCSVLALDGCSTTLAPTGVYQGDTVLYNADKSIVGAYDVLHTFVQWEAKNRQALVALPAITKAADDVRDNARKWIDTAVQLRTAYATNPNQQNRDALTTALSVLNTALLQASQYVKTPIPAH